MPRESSIVQAILKRARQIPGMLLRKRHGSVFGIAGEPDLYGCWNGKHLEIEVKQPRQSPTLLQLSRLSAWRGAGAVTAIVHSIEEFQELLLIAENGEALQSEPPAVTKCHSEQPITLGSLRTMTVDLPDDTKLLLVTRDRRGFQVRHLTLVYEPSRKMHELRLEVE